MKLYISRRTQPYIIPSQQPDLIRPKLTHENKVFLESIGLKVKSHEYSKRKGTSYGGQ